MQSIRTNQALTSSDALRVTLLVFFVVASLYFAQSVLKPLALAALLALVLTPCVKFLEARGFGRIPASALILLLTLGAFIGIGTAVSYQVATLADDLEAYQAALESKLSLIIGHDTLLSRAFGMLHRAGETLGGLLSATSTGAPVRIVSDPMERLHHALAPYVSLAGSSAVVLILLLFLLIKRDDMSDRIVGLFGQARIGLTTRAIDEAGRRISRYLSAFAAVNLFYGATIGIGLWAIGIPLAALWGVLAGLLRFIPYIGAAAGFVGPVFLAVVVYPGWYEPLLVVALFGVVEAALVGGAEPHIYGKSTGVSPIGLLVFALFWTWLWGPLGLLLSTPLTVSLAVAGKYVPGLGGLSTLLSEKTGLAPHLRLYQRLLAGDGVEARNIVQTALESSTPLQLFDGLLLPVVSKCQLDHRAGDIGSAERDAVWRALDDLLDDAEWKAGASMSTHTPGHAETPFRTSAPAHGLIVGVGSANSGDDLVLRMLNLSLAQWERQVFAIAPGSADSDVLTVVENARPAVIVISCVDAGEGAARSALASRLLQAAAGSVSIVGTWRAGRLDAPQDGEVREVIHVGTLAAAVDRILDHLQPSHEVAKRLEAALVEADLQSAEYLFERAARHDDLEALCRNFVEPVLRSVERRAQRGQLPAAAEAGVLAFLRKKLHGPVTAVRQVAPDAPRALVACPDCPHEDLDLMMITLALRSRGWDVLYLGGSVRGEEIAGPMLSSARPRVAIVSFVDATVPVWLADLAAAVRAANEPVELFALHGAELALPPAHDPRFRVLPRDLGKAVQAIELTRAAPSGTPRLAHEG